MSAAAQTVSQTKAPAKAKEARVPGWKQLIRLMPYLARYKGGMTIGLITLVAMGIVGNLVPLLMGIIFDCLQGEASPLSKLAGRMGWLTNFAGRYYAPLNDHALGLFCVVLIVAIAVKGIFSFLTRWILIGVSRDIEYDLRNDVLIRLMQMEPEFYVRNRTGELMSRATNDLNSVRMVLGPGIMYSGTTIVTMVASISVMLILSKSLTLWVLLPAPIVAVAVWYFGKVIHELYETIQAALATLSAKVQENLSGVRVIRAYAQEAAEIKGFDEPNRDYVA